MPEIRAFCQKCGHGHVVHNPAALEQAEDEQRRSMQDLVDELGIDPATAWSVLLFGLSKARARELSGTMPVKRLAIPGLAPPSPTPRRPRMIAALTDIVVVVAMGTLFTWYLLSGISGDSPGAVADRSLRSIRSTTFDADGHGRPVRVAAHDARLVLISYCWSGRPSPRCEPLHVAIPAGRGIGFRLGVFQRSYDPDRRYAIEIRRDRATREWVAESGGEPIQVTAAPTLPAGTATIPATF